MRREISLEEISDGRLYGREDMVKAGCQDCAGCSDCCRGMGVSLVLDPLDIVRLTAKLGRPFPALIGQYVDLHAEDGLILPHMRMEGDGEQCPFLNESGRCSIHSVRPGFCRLFPLGRYYENRSFRYILQVHECRKEPKTKVKVRKWLDTPNLREYEEFICRWHYFLLDLQEMLKDGGTPEQAKAVSMEVLNRFYITSFSGEESFYREAGERLDEAEKRFGLKAAKK